MLCTSGALHTSENTKLEYCQYGAQSCAFTAYFLLYAGVTTVAMIWLTYRDAEDTQLAEMRCLTQAFRNLRSVDDSVHAGSKA